MACVRVCLLFEMLQVFSENMSKKESPQITKCAVKGEYTCVTFYPDWARFKMVSP